MVCDKKPSQYVITIFENLADTVSAGSVTRYFLQDTLYIYFLLWPNFLGRLNLRCSISICINVPCLQQLPSWLVFPHSTLHLRKERQAALCALLSEAWHLTLQAFRSRVLKECMWGSECFLFLFQKNSEESCLRRKNLNVEHLPRTHSNMMDELQAFTSPGGLNWHPCWLVRLYEVSINVKSPNLLPILSRVAHSKPGKAWKYLRRCVDLSKAEVRLCRGAYSAIALIPFFMLCMFVYVFCVYTYIRMYMQIGFTATAANRGWCEGTAATFVPVRTL